MFRLCRDFRSALVFALALVGVPHVAAADPLTLARAEQLALEQAPWLHHHRTNVAAAGERVVYEGRLPDPQLTVGALNVPTDSFSLRDEDMTMIMVGLRQSFPPGATLELRERLARKMLTREQTMLELERRTLLRQLRQVWFELYSQEQSRRVIAQSRALQARALAAMEGRYRAAQEPQQSVLRARQALARLDEQALMVDAQAARLRAQLARWIGTEANAPLPEQLLEEAHAIERAFDVAQHPEWLAAQAGLEAAQVEIAMAREEYKPGIMLDVNYGFRQPMPDGTSRAGMLTVMATVDVPLFRGKRQDRRVAEKQSLETAARFDLEDRRRELETMYAAARAEHDALAGRVRIVAEQFLPNARREAEVSAAGFVRDANELREARMRALDAELELIRLRVELGKNRAELLYLTGEPQS